MAHYREVNRAGGKAWEVRWREGSTFKQRTFPTEGAAAEFVVELKLTKRDTGSTAHMARLGKRFRDVAEDSLAASAARLKSKTAEGYASAYRLYIYPTFGERRINSITSMEIERWLADMQTRLAPRTGERYSSASIHGAYVALSKVFAYALKHRLIAANPCTVVDKPRIEHTEPIFLEPEEVAAVAAELDAAHPYGLIVRFAAYTGLRAGELAALRVRDVNLMRRHVEVRRTVQRTKGGWTLGTPKSARSVRDVPLPGFLVQELTEYLAGHPHRADPSAALWPGRLQGGHGANRNAVDWSRPFDVSSLYRYYFKPTLSKLGIRSARWHDLRHFYASVCAHAGVDIRKVSRWMGHANINTTDSIYTHLFNGSATEDMDRLDTLAARPAVQAVPRIG
jgi:integrase